MPKRKSTAKPPVPRAPLPALRYWRKARGLTVEELRDALQERDCFVSVPLIYQWEAGSVGAILLYTRVLAAILDISIEALRAQPPEAKA